MYRIFNIQQTVENAIRTPPTWPYIKEGMETNIQRVIRYYRKSPMAVRSSHLLVKILHGLNVPRSMETERFYSNVVDRSLTLSMSLGLTSSIYKGRVFDGVFYGPGSQEIIIAHDEPFDYLYAQNNWENLEPIKVIRHPRSDIGFNIPDGTSTGVETGIAVILINIPMLAIQYRGFRMQEARYKMMMAINERTVYQFIHMYPLTNMIRSQTDCAIFNRLCNHFFYRPIGESTKKHSFALNNFDRKLDDYCVELKEYFGSNHKHFFQMLESVKLLSCDSLADFIKLPDMAPTRQVIWALSFGMFPVIEFLFKACNQSAMVSNAVEVNRILRQIQEYRYSNIVKSAVPTNMYIEFEQNTDMLFNLVNRSR